MRITNVRAVQPATPGSPPDWRTTFGQVLVAVETDSGLTGYGVGGGGPAALYVIDTVLRDSLMGVDPDPVEALWTNMYNATLVFGRKGLAIMALSGVDLALWDLRAKAVGKPVAVLLGGTVGQPIPAYATLSAGMGAPLPDGFGAFKVHARMLSDGSPDAVIQEVERVRLAAGPDAELMVDFFMSLNVDRTLELAPRLAELDVRWPEEPLFPDDWAGYARLSRESPVPVAGGEHEFTATAFQHLIDQRLHTVLQPDVCWCGGMTELVKIYAAAAKAGLRVCPHRGAEPWGLHAIAALDPQPLAESGRPWMNWVGGPEIEDGHVTLGNAPGFGVNVDASLFDD